MQDTGNPVLDSVVNLFQAAPASDIRTLHETVLEIAKKEPGGLKRHKDAVRIKSSESAYETTEIGE